MVSGEKEITLVDFGLAREAGKELEEGREGPRGTAFGKVAV